MRFARGALSVCLAVKNNITFGGDCPVRFARTVGAVAGVARRRGSFSILEKLEQKTSNTFGVVLPCTFRAYSRGGLIRGVYLRSRQNARRVYSRARVRKYRGFTVERRPIYSRGAAFTAGEKFRCKFIAAERPPSIFNLLTMRGSIFAFSHPLPRGAAGLHCPRRGLLRRRKDCTHSKPKRKTCQPPQTYPKTAKNRHFWVLFKLFLTLQDTKETLIL